MFASNDSTPPERIRLMVDGGTGEAVELPFLIGVLGEFSGMPEKAPSHLRYRRFVAATFANLDDLFRAYSPRLVFKVENKLAEDGGPIAIELRFSGIADFDPENVAHRIAPLKMLLDARTRLTDLLDKLVQDERFRETFQETVGDAGKWNRLRREVRPEMHPAAEERPASAHSPPPRRNLGEPPARAPEKGVWSRAAGAEPDEASVLDELTIADRSTRTENDAQRSKDLVREFVGEVMDGSMSAAGDVEGTIRARVAQIDELMGAQLNEVLHQPEFQRLEAAWRGLRYLLRSVRDMAGVEVRVLNVSKQELLSQFRRARGRGDDPISRKVLEQAFATLGATPFGLLIGDYEIMGVSPEDAELVERMSKLGAAAQVPFIAAAAPELLGLPDFPALIDAFQLDRVFDRVDYVRWRSVRARDTARYAGLVMPRILLRAPYGRFGVRVEAFEFEETAEAYLWGNATWAFAARTAAEFDRYGQFGGPRAAADLGEVPELPIHVDVAEEGLRTTGPTEVSVSDTRYEELRSIGVIPLCRREATNRAVFFERWPIHRPPADPDATPTETQDSVDIDGTLAAGRIAQCLAVLVRQHRQSFGTLEAGEEFLRKWLMAHVVPDYARGSGHAAAFPLEDAKLRIAIEPDSRAPARLELELRPRRGVGSLAHVVKVSIPVVLPAALTSSPREQGVPNGMAGSGSSGALMMAPPVNGSVNGATGRDAFLRRTFLAETAIRNRRLDTAILILEDLAEKIDRHRLDEWESPKLVSHVWDLLRRCHGLTSSSGEGDERCAALLRRICRLNPERALE